MLSQLFLKILLYDFFRTMDQDGRNYTSILPSHVVTCEIHFHYVLKYDKLTNPFITSIFSEVVRMKKFAESQNSMFNIICKIRYSEITFTESCKSITFT